MSSTGDTTSDDREAVRVALGRLGDQALPAPDFDDLHLRAVEAEPRHPVSPWPVRLLPLAAVAVVVIAAVGGLVAITAGDGDGVVADGPASDIVSPDPDPDPDPDPGSGEPAADGEAEFSTTPDETTGSTEENVSPNRSPEYLLEAVAELGATTLIAPTVGGEYLVARDGALSPVMGIDGFVRSDGRFIYGTSIDVGDEIAMNLDGEIVCRDEREIQHVTERQDGTYVLAAEFPDPVEQAGGPEGAYEYQLFAIDCQTGDEQLIAPIHRGGFDGETETVHRVGGRTLRAKGDAEGNVYELVDESGRNLIGDDYLGQNTFSSDAALLAFADQRAGASALVTKAVAVRDLEAGERLWSESLDGYVIDLWFVGDRLVVGTVSEDPTLGGYAIDTLIAFDARTGARLAELAAPPGVIFVG